MKRWPLVCLCSILSLNVAYCQRENADKFGPPVFEKDLPAFQKREALTAANPLPQSPKVSPFKKKEPGNLSRFYLKSLAGYGFLSPGAYSIKFDYFVRYADVNGTDTYAYGFVKSKNGFGEGYRVGLGAGFVVSDFLNLGLDFEYLDGNIKAAFNQGVNADAYTYIQEKWDYHAYLLTPNALLKALARPKFYLYSKLGLLLTLPMKLNTEHTRNQSWYTVDYFDNYQLNGVDYPFSHVKNVVRELEREQIVYNMKLGLGVSMAFGINFKINDHWRWFGELFANYSTMQPESLTGNDFHKVDEITQVDNENSHGEADYKFIQITNRHSSFKKGDIDGALVDGTFTFTDLGIDAEGYPQQLMTWNRTEPTYTINMTSLGIVCGITYRF